MLGITQTRVRGGQRHDVDAVPGQVRPHSPDRFRLRNAVPATQPGHRVNLRECARDDQVRMILHQRQDRFIIGAVGIVEVSLVDENHGFWRNLIDEFAQFILRGDAGGRVVRITNVNQSFRAGGQHLRQVMSVLPVERDLHDFGAINARVIDDRFVGGIGDNQLAAAGDELQCRSARRL